VGWRRIVYDRELAAYFMDEFAEELSIEVSDGSVVVKALESEAAIVLFE